MVPPNDTICRDDDAIEVSSDAIIQALQVEIAFLRSENAALMGRLAVFAGGWTLEAAGRHPAMA